MAARRFYGDLLLVDSNAARRERLGIALGDCFRVHTPPSGDAALALLAEIQPRAVVVAPPLPSGDTIALLDAARTAHPHSVRALITEGDDLDLAVEAINRGEIHRFFRPPIDEKALAESLSALMARRESDELHSIHQDARKKAQELTEGASGRVLIVAEPGHIRDRIEEACSQKAYQTRVVEPGEQNEEARVAIMDREADLVVVVRAAGLEPGELCMLTHLADETLGFVILDPEPSLRAALDAHSMGASDYLGGPFDDVDHIARRLERAAHTHISQRDLRRLTNDLILTNRELTAARRRIEVAQVKVLNAMIQALEARDAYTAGHTDRVAGVSVRIARELSYENDRIEHIRVGALLHDIGKIGIRDEVLLKPGPLTPAEFETIKTHTTIGDELLRDIEQFQCVMSMVRNHHEKMDGSGYPDGLKGQSIPTEARVVAVADVFDALTSDRPYRRGSSAEVAFEIMAGMEGHHLDPEMVTVLRDLHRHNQISDLMQSLRS